MFLVVAHRGDPSSALENTIPAFKSALESGADYVELDVRRTKDGVLVVSHDADLRRVFGLDMKISEFPYGILKEKTLQISEGKYYLPTLKEALELLASGDQGIIVEIKEAGYEKEIIGLIRKLGVEDKVLLASFDFRSLKRVSQISRLPLVPITNHYTTKILKFAVSLRASILALRKDVVKPETIKEVTRRGIIPNAWIINRVDEAYRYYTWGVPVISTDYPKRMVEAKNKIRRIVESLFQ